MTEYELKRMLELAREFINRAPTATPERAVDVLAWIRGYIEESTNRKKR